MPGVRGTRGQFVVFNFHQTVTSVGVLNQEHYQPWCISWNTERMRDGQSQDQDISWIMQKKIDSVLKPKWHSILSESAGPKILWTQWELLEIVDGLLYKKGNQQRMLVLPWALRKEIV